MSAIKRKKDMTNPITAYMMDAIKNRRYPPSFGDVTLDEVEEALDEFWEFREQLGIINKHDSCGLDCEAFAYSPSDTFDEIRKSGTTEYSTDFIIWAYNLRQWATHKAKT